MLKIAVCDDSDKDLNKLATLLELYIKEQSLTDVHISRFSHPDELLLQLDNTVFDLYLLDIVMPMYTGIDLGREIRSRSSKAEIIYFTSSSEFAIDAFSVKASHYILKPYSKEEFFEALDRSVTNILSKPTKYIGITTKSGEHYNLDINEICCVESQGHDINIHTGESDIITVKSSLSDLLVKLESLSPRQFISPYKGYIVNFQKVRWISKDGITLKSNAKIPIPKRNYKQLHKQFEDYMFGGNGK